LRLALPDWLIYAALLAAVLAVCLVRRERIMAPPAPPPVPGAAQMPLAPDSPFAALPVAQVRGGRVRAGHTAFSLGGAGGWITAAGAGDCTRPGVMVADGRAVAAKTNTRSGLLTSLVTRGAGSPNLTLARPQDLSPGEAGFAVGYPRGGPGEVATRLIGPAMLKSRARGSANGAVLAWAELGHTEGLGADRPGLIGAPMLDGQGRVAGVVVGQAPRRGMLYTAPPGAIARLAPGAPAPPADPIGADNYGRAADALRRDLRIVQVVCLDR
jgi:hypothetical protein